MAKSDMHPVHHFEPWQVWPGSYKNKFVPGEYPLPEKSGLLIDKTTPIASMGSCFAREIRKVLLRQDYNYILEETEKWAACHASAAWERTYNTFCMRQIFDYTFNEFKPETRWWVSPDSGQVQDPYRRIILYESIEDAEKDFDDHVQASRRAIQNADVFILTLGLTEIWENIHDQSVICLPSGPYVNEGGNMSDYRFRVSRYLENLDNLESIYQTLKKNNNDCKLIITISPVHLWATFRQDMDVISANCNSKSTLRSVADEFVYSHEDVFYFPSYEIATTFNQLMNISPFVGGKENFHINQDTVELIMKHFFQFFASQEKA